MTFRIKTTHEKPMNLFWRFLFVVVVFFFTWWLVQIVSLLSGDQSVSSLWLSLFCLCWHWPRIDLSLSAVPEMSWFNCNCYFCGDAIEKKIFDTRAYSTLHVYSCGIVAQLWDYLHFSSLKSVSGTAMPIVLHPVHTLQRYTNWTDFQMNLPFSSDLKSFGY